MFSINKYIYIYMSYALHIMNRLLCEYREWKCLLKIGSHIIDNEDDFH